MNDLQPFSEVHAERLVRFLSAPERPQGTMSYESVSGLLFAVACSPEMVPPSEWMPLIFNEEDPDYRTMEEAQVFLESLMALYNHVNTGVREHPIALPPGIEMRSPAMANLDEDAPLSLWAKGFSATHYYLSEAWKAYTPEDIEEELRGCVLVLSFFVGHSFAKAYYKELKTKKPLDELVEDMLRLFPDAMKSYAHLGWSIQTVLQQREARPEPVRSQKIGRNEPCPCGSGKKYKKCCGGDGVVH